MTRKIKLTYGDESSSTVISNIFIDRYMAQASGLCVKVYIYLLRCTSDPVMSDQLSVCAISEQLDETERDILKALRYLEDQGLMALSFDGEQITGIRLTDLDGQADVVRRRKPRAVSEPEVRKAPEEPAEREAPAALATVIEMPRPTYTSSQIEQFLTFPEYRELIDHIEERFGHTLSQRDLQTPSFLFEGLGFSTELIRFLVDYCCNMDKRSFSYIEKVAREWSTRGIDSINRARQDVLTHSKAYKAVMDSFAIKNRALGSKELSFLSSWIYDLGMSDELIKEACDRTIIQAHDPSFSYANSILSRWHKAAVTSLDDIRSLDESHEQLSKARSEQAAVASAKEAIQARQQKNAFNRFPQRAYTEEDYKRFERKKLNLNP